MSFSEGTGEARFRLLQSALLWTVLVSSLSNGVCGRAEDAAPRRLTTDGILKRDPVWKRVGEGYELVWSVQQDSVLMVLVRLDPQTGTVERLHPKANEPEFKPSYSADGKRYAFLRSRGNQNVSLIVKDTGSDGEKQLDGTARNSMLAPDGSQVWFSQPGSGGQQIVAIPAEGGAKRSVAVSANFNNWPAVSPDGKSVAFASDREDGDLEIWVVGADGEGLRRVTRSPGRDIRPAWSPDGRWLAFVSARSGDTEIWVQRADGSGDAVNVSKSPERDDFPSWHPDGRRLVWVAERDGRFDVWEVEVAIASAPELVAPASAE